MREGQVKAQGALFVYGTLKRGEPNHAHVASAARIEAGRTSGHLYSLVEGYPALVDAEDGVVEGEVCFFDEIERVLPALDELEGVGSEGGEGAMFTRGSRNITLGSGDAIRAVVYLVSSDREAELVRRGALRVDSGVWRSENGAGPAALFALSSPTSDSPEAGSSPRSGPRAPDRRSGPTLFVLIALAFVILLQSIWDDVTGIRSPQKGTPAPPFRSVTPKGEPIDLTGFRDSVVLVDFWATWCPPCVASMPVLERVSRDYRDKGLVVLGVNQEAGAEELVQVFVESHSLSFPIAMDSGGIAHMYGVHSFPTSFLIGRDGVVRAMYRGVAREPVLRRDIEDALLHSSGSGLGPTGDEP